MAISNHALFLVVFTMPADGHKFKHARRMNTLDNEAKLRNEAIPLINKDLKILGVKRLGDDPHENQKIVEETAKAIQEEGGPDYRPEQGAEWQLTQAQVDRINAENKATESTDTFAFPGDHA